MKRRTTFIIAGTITTAITGILMVAAFASFAPQSANAKTVDSNKDDTTTDIQLGEVKPVNVKTSRIEASDLTEYVLAHGVTEPKTDVTFSAEVAGRIEQIGPDLGDRVKRGQLLARIDTSGIRAQNAQAKAQFNLAKSTYKRLAELDSGYISKQKLDESRTQLTSSKAQLAMTRTNVAKSVVRSSIDGMVTAKYMDKAEYAGPGTRLFRVVDLSTIIIDAQLAETQIAKVRLGMKVAVHIDALGQEFEGNINTIVPTADPVSKTFTIRVEIDNSDERIYAGMAAKLKITAGVHEKTVTVSQDVIIEGQGMKSVFVASDGVAKKRTVHLGPMENDRVVVLDGLNINEELIVLGHRDLSDGQSIRVVR